MSVNVSDYQQLPAPDDYARGISEKLVDCIKQEIQAQGGLISFEHYMQMALYQPGLGYYSAGATKLGADGDFITAPESTPLFGRCLALQCEQILRGLGAGSILELGAGSGKLALDILRQLEDRDCLPAEYLILEISADLRERQSQTLAELPEQIRSRIRWLDEFPAAGFIGVVLANEVIDAMPVILFQIEQDKISEVCVHETEQGLSLGLMDGMPEEQQQSIRGLFAQQPESTYTSEYNPNLAAWLGGLSDGIEKGCLLFIDYGSSRAEYYHPERTAGSLMCYYRHRGHDNPLWYPGLQDITADVDFTSLAQAGVAHDLRLEGYTTQAHFLMGCGLDQVLQDAQLKEPERVAEYLTQVRQLTMPDDMGERFKVMAFSRDLQIPLRGFQFFNHLHRL